MKRPEGQDWIGIGLLVTGAAIAAASALLIAFGGVIGAVAGIPTLAWVLLLESFIANALWSDLRD